MGMVRTFIFILAVRNFRIRTQLDVDPSCVPLLSTIIHSKCSSAICQKSFIRYLGQQTENGEKSERR
jgi:hypothetical protein